MNECIDGRDPNEPYSNAVSMSFHAPWPHTESLPSENGIATSDHIRSSTSYLNSVSMSTPSAFSVSIGLTSLPSGLK